MKALGRPEATCPKSWRHSYATLLQDANVDPLIRQQTLGHKPTNGNGLGMTANYTHTRGETQYAQIEQRCGAGRTRYGWPLHGLMPPYRERFVAVRLTPSAACAS